MREGDKSSRMTFRNKPRSSNGKRIHLLPMSARGIVGSTHSLPATFPGTQNARSLLGGSMRTVGTYSRLRRCGRSPSLVTAASSDTTNRGRAGQSGRSIGRGIACSTSCWANGRAFIGGTASGGSARVIRLNYSGGSSVFICRGLGLRGLTGVRQVRTCHRSIRQPIHSVGSVSAPAR